MNSNSGLLVEFFEPRRRLREPLVLATVIHTEGSTYRKPGAQMLIASDGQVAGLLSGGCAESDLLERAATVFTTGTPQVADYDTRGSDDAIWGIGLGCEGAMRILLTRLDATNDYQPFAYLSQCLKERKRGAQVFVVATQNAKWTLGQALYDDAGVLPEPIKTALQGTQATNVHVDDATFFVAPISLPARVLLLGAGADAQPVAEIAGLLGWQLTVADHRPAYAQAPRFPRAHRVILAPAIDLPRKIVLEEFDAAVVMSHHLPTDLAYLSMLAAAEIRYVGLLGPPARRHRLLSELGHSAASLTSRLAGPIGLDIGAETAEAIALAIVAEIHAYLYGRSGASFSGLLQALPKKH